MPGSPETPSGPITSTVWATGYKPTPDDIPSPFQEATLPPSPGTFSPAPPTLPSCVAVAASSPVWVSPPTRLVPQRRTDTGRCLSAKRHCTSDSLLCTSLEVSTYHWILSLAQLGKFWDWALYRRIGIRAVGGPLYAALTLELGCRRFLIRAANGSCLLVTVRNSRRDTAPGAGNHRVAYRSCRNWQQILIWVDLGSSIVDMPFVRNESDLLYICALYNVVKQASAGKIFKNILWVFATLAHESNGRLLVVSSLALESLRSSAVCAVNLVHSLS